MRDARTPDEPVRDDVRASANDNARMSPPHESRDLPSRDIAREMATRIFLHRALLSRDACKPSLSAIGEHVLGRHGAVD